MVNVGQWLNGIASKGNTFTQKKKKWGMPLILLALQETPKLRSFPTLPKPTEGEQLYTLINKNSVRCNVISSKSAPAQSSAEFWERKGYF